MFNHINGRENHLVKIKRVKNYIPLAQDNPLKILEKKKQKQKKAVAKGNKKQKIR